MSTPPLSLPQLVSFLREVIVTCRLQAACACVPEFAQVRLRDAAGQVEFFLSRHALRRAFFEAKRATALYGAVDRFLRASTDATAALRAEISPP
jgi:hypothetical protein